MEIQNKIKLLDRIDMSGVVGLPATFVVANYTELKAFFFFIPLIIQSLGSITYFILGLYALLGLSIVYLVLFSYPSARLLSKKVLLGYQKRIKHESGLSS